MGKLLRIFDLLTPLRTLIGGGLPTYGTCAGMILLAAEVVDGRHDQELLGGLDITVRRNAFGSQVESFETDLAVTGVGDVHAVFIRAPWVERAGPAVEVLDGRHDQTLLGGLDITVRRNAFGSQVHSFEGDLEVVGVGTVHGVFIRAPWVERAGPSVDVLASVGEHPVAVQQGHLLATSFHPELTGDERMHRYFVTRLVRNEGGPT